MWSTEEMKREKKRTQQSFQKQNNRPLRTSSASQAKQSLNVIVVLFGRSDIIYSMKKKVQKKEEMAKVFTSDEVMSLLEHMSEGIEVAAEAQLGMNFRIDGLNQRFDGLENRFGGLEQKFEGLERKFDRLEHTVDRLQDNMTDVKQTLSVKVDRTEFLKLEKRIVKVERIVFDGVKVRS